MLNDREDRNVSKLHVSSSNNQAQNANTVQSNVVSIEGGEIAAESGLTNTDSNVITND